MSETTPADAEAHDHCHADVSGGWLRAAVFGAMDGLVTNTALVAGVGGGGAQPRAIVLAGVASLVAGAISMSLGEYTSVKTQNEQLDLEVAKERRELERNAEGELAELTEMLRVRGVEDGLASEVAAQLSAGPGGGAAAARRRRAGAEPRGQAVAVGGRGLVVPDLRHRARCCRCCPTCSACRVLWVALLFGGVGLLVAGALSSRFTPRPWWYSGLRQLLFGAVAAGVTYGIGAAIGVGVA